jgi:SpoVK/Ycf46/Vps4 family AAA+-type ATPase
MTDLKVSTDLLTSVQMLSSESKGQALTEELIESMAEFSSPIMDFFGITHFQSIVFAHLIEAELRSLIVDNERITDTFGKKLSALASVNLALDELLAKKLIYHKRSEYGMRRKNDRNKIIAVHDKMLDALMTGDASLLTTTQTEDFQALLAEVRELIVKRMEKIISTDELVDQTMQILTSNNALPEVKWLLKIEGIDKYDMVLLLNLTIETFEDGDRGESDMSKLVNEVFSEIRDRVRYKRNIKENKCPLYTLKLVEFSDNDFSFMDYTRLSEESMEMLLGGAVEVTKKAIKPKFGTLIAPDKIVEEELFYNEAEQKQIDTLVKALQKDNYERIAEKLKSKGSIPNCIGIMAGLPGVGKTASCYQIAKRTNRYVYFIDLEKISSKWVGQSSKNTVALFQEVNDITNYLGEIPCCIFNEVDQVLNQRLSSDSSVAAEKNGVIAQFLQQFETFSGIAFLTTNLVDNIDSGFMRRILFKIVMHPPKPDVRKKILTKVFDEINEDTINLINSKYELTGAQIGNVSKKLTVSTLLDDTINKDEYIMELCEEELVFSKSNRKPIGFVQ